MKNELSFAIVGLGSIGQRHLSNLLNLGQRNITLIRTGHSTLTNELLQQFPVESDLQKVLRQKPTAVIVSNPSSMHINTALQATAHGVHVLIEKPVSNTLEHTSELTNLIDEQMIISLIGFQFRFHPALRHIEQWLTERRIGKIISVHAHWGEYLPGWHPWENYQHSYSGRKELGGGPLLTLCHPIDYLRWLIGEIESVYCASNKISHLNIDTEDTAAIILRFQSGAIGTVYLDYVENPARHELSIIGETGIIQWNNKTGAARLIHAQAEHLFTPDPRFERNTMFLHEMQHFIESIKQSKKTICDIHDGIMTLKIVLAAKQSALERREIRVADIV
ncbi:Gfo/Idh/MocA family oxidoreductase [candidate division KSB1 bacterium]|nr:Gfo/Idh/MocA family oxidoreductase [candidate division KSB1 bacterium]